jgi:tape measure domain-containing protein
MPSLTSENQVGILIKADADLKAIDSTNKELRKLDNAADNSSRRAAALGAAGRLAAVGIAAAGAATAAAGVMAIKSAGDYEQSRIAFETMLGSADKARVMMTDIAAFAKTTPFELPEVVAGSKQLLAYGYAQEEILPNMRKIGDIASGVGVPVGQLTTIFGQVKVAGRLMGQDLLQFTNAGVPMISALATVMGKPQTEIKKLIEEGKVGFPEVEAALNSLTGEGSKFGGMMEKQSGSFNGVVSNIKDGFGQMLRSAVGISPAGDIVAGGVFDRIKIAAQSAMPKITAMIPTVTKAVTMLVNVLSILFTAFGKVFNFLNQNRIVLAIVAGMIAGILVSAFVAWAIAAGTAAVAAGTAAVAAGTAAVATIAATWPILAIGAAVGAVAYLIITHWETIKNAFMAGINWIKDNWQTLIAILTGPIGIAVMLIIRHRDSIVNAFKAVGGWIASALGNVYNAITSPFSRAWDFIKDIPGRIVNSIGNVGNLLRTKLGDWDIPGPLGKVKDVIPGFASGGYTGAGGVNEVAGIVHRGEYVVPQSMVDQSTGLPKMGVTNNRSVSIGSIYLGSADAVREMFKQLDADTLLASKGMTTVRGGM